MLKFREGSLNISYVKKHWKILVFMGLMSVTIYQSGYLIGEIFTSASDASIMVATNAVWVIIISTVILKTESFSWKKIFGTILAFASVVIVVGFSPNFDVKNRILGDIFILIAAFSYAIYSVTSHYFLNKTKVEDQSFEPSSLWILTWVSFFGFLITTPIALIISPEYLNPLKYINISLPIWVGIGYLAFLSTVGAYTFYVEGIKRLDASRAAIFQTLVPLFGVILSAIFLREKFDFLIYPISLLLVISGIILVNLKSTMNKEKQIEKEI
ncbi:MAG: DMT family transporter [Candidatus Lokiarchaeota archaeon]